MILFLDASTTTVGWALSDNSREHVVDSGAKNLGKRDWVSRVSGLSMWLTEFCFTKRPVNRIVYELATGNRGNMATNRKLGAVQYVILLVARNGRVPCDYVTASQVRATGVHKKALDAAERYKGAPLDEKLPGDEADALGVMKAWWATKRTGIIITEGD